MINTIVLSRAIALFTAVVLLVSNLIIARADPKMQTDSWSEPERIAQNASRVIGVSDSQGSIHLFYVEGWFNGEAGAANRLLCIWKNGVISGSQLEMY